MNATANWCYKQIHITNICKTFHQNTKRIYPLFNTSGSFPPNWTHTWTQSAFLQIQENGNKIICPIWPSHIKAGYQQMPEKAWEITETEQFQRKQKIDQDEIWRERKGFLELIENEYITYQNLQYTINMVIRGMFYNI